jgi:hypothetical protein
MERTCSQSGCSWAQIADRPEARGQPRAVTHTERRWDNDSVSDQGGKRPKPITTIHLGQYDRETANAIAGRLERAGIVWWYKEPGFLSQVWEFGVRLFVDRDRLDDARQIAERVSRRQAAKRAAREAEGREDPP